MAWSSGSAPSMAMTATWLGWSPHPLRPWPTPRWTEPGPLGLHPCSGWRWWPLWGSHCGIPERGAERTRRRRLGRRACGGARLCWRAIAWLFVACTTRLVGNRLLPLRPAVCLALLAGFAVWRGHPGGALVGGWCRLAGPRRWSTAWWLTAAIWGPWQKFWLSRSPPVWIRLGTSPLPEIGPLAAWGPSVGPPVAAAQLFEIAGLLLAGP